MKRCPIPECESCGREALARLVVSVTVLALLGGFAVAGYLSIL